MPRPMAGEEKDRYISRCMSSPEAKHTAPSNEHRFALCNGMWEQAHKSIDIGEEFDEAKYLADFKKKLHNKE